MLQYLCKMKSLNYIKKYKKSQRRHSNIRFTNGKYDVYLVQKDMLSSIPTYIGSSNTNIVKLRKLIELAIFYGYITANQARIYEGRELKRVIPTSKEMLTDVKNILRDEIENGIHF